VLTWRRQTVLLLSEQGMDVEQIARAAFTSPDRVRDRTTLPVRRRLKCRPLRDSYTGGNETLVL
jgi:hypothetical protein